MEKVKPFDIDKVVADIPDLDMEVNVYENKPPDEQPAGRNQNREPMKTPGTEADVQEKPYVNLQVSVQSINDSQIISSNRSGIEENSNDAIEITVVPNAKKLQNLQRDIEQNIIENNAFKQKISAQVQDEIHTQKGEDTIGAYTREIPVTHNDQLKPCKQLCKLLLLIGVLATLILALVFTTGGFTVQETFPKEVAFTKDQIITIDVGGTNKIKVEYWQLLSVDGSKLQE